MPDSKYEATIAFLPYVTRVGETGKQPNVLSCTAGFSLITSRIPHRTSDLAARRLLNTGLPDSLKYAILDAFRHVASPLEHASDAGAMVRHWIAAVNSLPQDVSESVVDTLLRMAFRSDIRPHISAAAWRWLKKRPILHRDSRGLKFGASPDVFQAVQELGDPEITTSYLFVVWSEWALPFPEGFAAMLDYIKSELRGVEMVGYRADLIKRLDEVLSNLEQEPGPPSIEVADRISWYNKFRSALMEVNEEAKEANGGVKGEAKKAMNTPTCSSSTLLPGFDC